MAVASGNLLDSNVDSLDLKCVAGAVECDAVVCIDCFVCQSTVDDALDCFVAHLPCPFVAVAESMNLLDYCRMNKIGFVVASNYRNSNFVSVDDWDS